MSYKVLVIDDDPAVRGAFELVLSEAGYRVTLAENGLDGVASVTADCPDMVFLDLKMPGIDGVETLRRIKAVAPSLVVYIVTAFSNEFMDQLKAAYDEGLQFQLASKPLSSFQIRQLARSAIALPKVNTDLRCELSLYVVSLDQTTQALIARIREILSTAFTEGAWSLEVVEVLNAPEKALENEVFATPMLMREHPKPSVRLMGDLTNMGSVLAAITAPHEETQSTIII